MFSFLFPGLWLFVAVALTLTLSPRPAAHARPRGAEDARRHADGERLFEGPWPGCPDGVR